MKSLITFEDRPAFQEFVPVFSSITSISSTSLTAKKRQPTVLKNLKNELCVKDETGICLAISLHDGAMLFVSNTIKKFLGYSKNMLLGQSIFNYLYPHDRLTVANQLTQGLQSQFNETIDNQTQTEATFFCRVRQYHSLECGFGVVGKKAKYKTFKFNTYLKNIPNNDDAFCEESAYSLCLIATLTPVSSAYKISEEIPPMSSFSTRHTADCHLSHIDSSSIPYLGYLPQDVLGFSIFDFYHVDDLPQLKDIYELVIKEQGNSFRSKPYRFKAFNGNYVFLETEWSCFINPWSKKLEFVIGQHRVLKGPANPNVFENNIKEDCVVSDEILRESQRIQEEIRVLLLQPVKGNGETVRHRCSKRRVEFASFVSSLVDDMCQGKSANATLEHEPIEQCGSVQESVVIGEISPHQEYTGSDPYTCMTPANSQEIRYKDNIERFFASQPKTYSSSDDSCEIKNNNCRQTCSMICEESGKNSLLDSGYASMQAKSDSFQRIDQSQGSSSKISGAESSSLTEKNLSQHNRLTQKYKEQQRKAQLGEIPSPQIWKETRLKRGCSPQRNENTKHNKNGKGTCNITLTQPDFDCPVSGDRNVGQQTVPLQAPGYIPMGPFSLNPLCPTVVPPISQGYSMPWGNLSTPNNAPTAAYNSNAPHGMSPQYCFIPDGNIAAGGLPSPFFMPVMCFGTMPIYPSLPTVPNFNTGQWSPFINNQQTSNSGTQRCHLTSATSNRNTHPAHSIASNISRKDKRLTPQIKTTKNSCTGNSGLLNNDLSNSVKVITSFSGTVCKESSRTFTQPKSDKMQVGTEESHVHTQMDVQQEVAHECEQDSASTCMSSTLSLLKSTGFSSNLPSDKTDLEMTSKGVRRMSKQAPWMEGLEMTPDVIYRYQLTPKSLEEVLKEDLKFLKSFPQPKLVNNQLFLLQSELLTEATRRSEMHSEDRSEKVEDSSHCLTPSQQMGSLDTSKDTKKEMDLGFATFEDDVGEELQAKEEEILHYICDNM